MKRLAGWLAPCIMAATIVTACDDGVGPTQVATPPLAPVAVSFAPTPLTILQDQPHNVIGAVASYEGEVATERYRAALQSLLAGELTRDRRSAIQDKLHRLHDAPPSGRIPTTEILTLSDACDGDLCEGEDPNAAGIRDFDTSASIDQVVAFVVPSGLFAPLERRCNDVTVTVGSSFNVVDCSGLLTSLRLTTEIPLDVNVCPPSGHVTASTVHTVDSDVAYSNDQTPCTETRETITTSAGAAGQPTEEYSWCWVTSVYINGHYRYSIVDYCW